MAVLDTAWTSPVKSGYRPLFLMTVMGTVHQSTCNGCDRQCLRQALQKTWPAQPLATGLWSMSLVLHDIISHNPTVRSRRKGIWFSSI